MYSSLSCNQPQISGGFPEEKSQLHKIPPFIIIIIIIFLLLLNEEIKVA